MPELKKIKKKVKAPKSQKVKQGHKLVWLTLIIIAIPCVLVGYVLITSMGQQNQPVIGSRFDRGDIDPKISEDQLNQIQQSLSEIGGVEGVIVDLKSATLRAHLNIAYDASQDSVNAIVEDAYNRIAQILPIEQYFTNNENGKMYDLEVDGYNYLVDEAHPQESQIYIKITKTGAGERVVDILSQPKDQDLVNQIVRG